MSANDKCLTIGIFLALSVFVNCCCAPSVMADEQNQIVRIATGEWPPYTSQEIENLGCVIQIVREAFELEGYDVEFGFFPWTRSFELARDGSWDCSVLWIKTPEREKEFIYSDPVIQSRKVLFRRKNYGFRWSSLGNLKDQRMGLTRSYAYFPGFREAAKKHGINTIDSETDLINMRLLLEGRHNWHPNDLFAGLYLLKTALKPAEADQITCDPIVLATIDEFVIFPKLGSRSVTLNDVFNRGLAALKKNGRFDLLSQPINVFPTVKVGMPHYPPWKIVDSGKFSGIDTDIINELSKRTGIQFEYVELTWKRAVEMLRSGDIDMVTSFNMNDDRKQFSVYLQPSYRTGNVCFYSLDDSDVQISEYSDLAGKSIAMVNGSAYFKEFDEDLSLRKVIVAKEDQLLSMLKSKRVDLVIGFEKPMDSWIVQSHLDGKTIKHSFQRKMLPCYLAISKESVARIMIPNLQIALVDLINEGFVERTIDSYFSAESLFVSALDGKGQ